MGFAERLGGGRIHASRSWRRVSTLSANSSWLEWLDGSAPLFWNWPQEYQREVRDGQPHYLMGTFGPPFLRPQSKHKDPAKQELMRAKVVKVWRLEYIKAGRIKR